MNLSKMQNKFDRKVDNLIMEQYPQGVYVKNASKISSSKVFLNLSSVFPRSIFDDKEKKLLIKFLRFENLGRIELDDQKIVSFTSSEEMVKRMKESFEEIELKSERVILSSIYEKLAKIAMVRTSLNPIYNLLKAVYDGKLLKSKLDKYPKSERYKKYVNFLCNLGILKEESSKYVGGNYFIEIEKGLKRKDEELILNKIFGLVVKEGKTYLFNNLNITVVKPFIRVSNVYYSQSYLAGKLLSLKKESLLNNYNKAYNLKTAEVNFDSYLDQLKKADILEENGFVEGNKEIFSRFSQQMAAEMAPKLAR